MRYESIAAGGLRAMFGQLALDEIEK